MHINILKKKKNMHCAIYKGFLDDPITKQCKSALLQAARLMPVAAIFALWLISPTTDLCSPLE